MGVEVWEEGGAGRVEDGGMGVCGYGYGHGCRYRYGGRYVGLVGRSVRGWVMRIDAFRDRGV